LGVAATLAIRDNALHPITTNAQALYKLKTITNLLTIQKHSVPSFVQQQPNSPISVSISKSTTMSSAEVAAPAKKGGRGRPKTTKSVSRSSKAGLQFPVGRVARYLKAGRYAQRVGSGSPVYLTAVLEYLAAEVRLIIRFTIVNLF